MFSAFYSIDPSQYLSPYLPTSLHPFIPNTLPEVILGTSSIQQEIINLILSCLFIHYLFIPLVSRLLVQPLILRSSRITTSRMQDVTEVMSGNDIFTALMIVGFDLYVRKYRPKTSTPTLTEWIVDNPSGTFAEYLEDPSRARLFKEFSTADLAMELTTHLQHTVAGVLGLLAFLNRSDVHYFGDMIRLGLLWEAGWELGDLAFTLLPKFFSCKAGFFDVFTLLHHVVLTLYFPILKSLDSSISDEVACSVFLLAGSVGPIGLINFVKNNVYDLDDPSDVVNYFTLQLIQCFTYVAIRGPIWWVLAYRMLVETWETGERFRVTAVGVVIMTFVNLVIMDFCRTGLIKAMTRVNFITVLVETHETIICVVTEETIREEDEAEREAKPFPQSRNPVERVRRRKKSLFEPLMAKVNQRRKSQRKSTNVMGFDMTEEK